MGNRDETDLGPADPRGADHPGVSVDPDEVHEFLALCAEEGHFPTYEQAEALLIERKAEDDRA